MGAEAQTGKALFKGRATDRFHLVPAIAKNRMGMKVSKSHRINVDF
jgi:hypothetical protein